MQTSARILLLSRSLELSKAREQVTAQGTAVKFNAIVSDNSKKAKPARVKIKQAA